jgi:hypothetical protein
MWLNGNLKHPTLNYGSCASNNKLSDLVQYEQVLASGDRAVKTIHGVNVQNTRLSCRFRWRGAGLLCVVSSDWYVVDMSAFQVEGDPRPIVIAVIFFTNTLFTPYGMDVIVRRVPLTRNIATKAYDASSCCSVDSGEQQDPSGYCDDERCTEDHINEVVERVLHKFPTLKAITLDLRRLN